MTRIGPPGLKRRPFLKSVTASQIQQETAMNEPIDDYIDAVARMLRLPLQDAWRPAIRSHLEVSLRLARQVEEFPLPDETEPASVFTA
jgi:hypothetical protein